MDKTEQFKQIIDNDYTFKGESFVLGAPVLNGEVLTGSYVRVPLKSMNRHGLIAGATGTGKTKTLQVIAENLSEASVSVVMLDIKGDLSGLAAAGSENKVIRERYPKMNLNYQPTSFPVELMTISNERGVPLRATVTEFGPILLAKILELNDTQTGVVSLIFKFCDDHQLPLVDLKDFIKVLQYITAEGKEDIEKAYGKVSTASTGTILRKVIGLQQQGADLFFGEPSFDVDDLMRVDEQGRGMINIIRVTDMQDKPQLFSTFLLQMLAELYATSPEEGDLDKPKLIMFIDEAHLVFQEASSALLKQIETMIKLIRSKGIGIFFCTQNPTDVPPAILGQLGFKVQHALRAFTAKDRKAIKSMAENFPPSDYYQTDELLTQMGVGEALVTVLNEKGIPTALSYTMLTSPRSRMDILTDVEIEDVVKKSKLLPKYRQAVDNYTAFEILSKRIEQQEAEAQKVRQQQEIQKAKTATQRSTSSSRKKPQKTMLEEILSSPAVKQIGRTASTELVRGLFGVLGLSKKR
ncbi:helicase HerA-like domain-containing protein [Parabacteroides sp. PF5-9]|uniref:helicase HerA-like domain-containing protein n=1 Tax=Parabacteroides sp. PF5-9 TaxID=1742404 RepID=UPI002475BCA0|nr:helicase HerA-like domain-containing protein [Parabacteroides sp. PF5-9]MDH6358082.1 DNA helicase HerA-like ATPase [Parabacteroides sp. PF5-9]